MEKDFHKILADINYDGRKFTPKINSENFPNNGNGQM